MKILCTFDEMIDLVEKCAERRANSCGCYACGGCALDDVCAGGTIRKLLSAESIVPEEKTDE